MKAKLKLYSLPLTCLLATLPLSALATSPSSSSPSTCTATPGDTGAVADAVRSFYEAERTGDSARWRSLTTPDFYMFHEGENMPPDDFAKWIDQEHELIQKNNGTWWTMDIRNPRVSVDCATAFTTWSMHNVMDLPNAPSLKRHPAYDETFMESYLLRKAPDGHWKIAFWNSSKVPKLPTTAGERASDTATKPGKERTPDAAPTTCTASPADSGAILETIRGWYAAGGAGDETQFHALITPDFYIFDDGKRLTGNELIHAAQTHFADGSKASWTISNPLVHVDCNTALSTFTALSSFSRAGYTRKVTFLEAAILRKEAGRWRIAFFHGTAVPEPDRQ